MQVMFFGRLGEAIGRSIEIDASPSDVAELRRMLATRYPALAEELMRPSLRACVGDELVGEAHLLSGVSTVDFLPPLSGG